MSSEHTKSFKVKRAATELIIAEADLMGIKFPNDNKTLGHISVLQSDVIDFTHSLIHRLNDMLQGYTKEDSRFIGIPIGQSTYVVMKDGRALRSVKALGAREAHAQLKLRAGEELFIKVGDE